MTGTKTAAQAWFRRPGYVALWLFIAAIFPRLPGLRLFLTSDENNSIFFGGSDVIAAFLRGDWRGTYWHFYPGVTISWLDALGMTGQYMLDMWRNRPLPAFTDYIYGDILSLLVANRLPYVILTAVAVPATYLLARHLLPNRVALLGTLFMAFDPFYLAHSRVVHGDAPVAVFMSLSALTFFISAAYPKTVESQSLTLELPHFLHHAQRSSSYLIASAVLGGLAALTKAPGQFMALFIILMSLIYALLEFRPRQSCPEPLGPGLEPARSRRDVPRSTTRIITHWTCVIVMWGLVSLFVFILLWPSMWVDPLGTVRQMWVETFAKVDEGHLVYFFGQPTLDPGPWFYPYVIPFRLTPITLSGTLLSLLLFIPGLTSSPKPYPIRNTQYALSLLWFFTVTLLLFGNLSPKKQDRYLLPLFPFLNLIAAIGWLNTLALIYDLFKAKISSRNIQLLINRLCELPSLRKKSSLICHFEEERREIPVESVGISPSGRNDMANRHNPLITNLLLSTLLLLHFLPTLTYYPYYLTYFNPLLGGPTRAAETTLMGWGEGMEQVAAYLNTKPNAEHLYVASTPSQTLLPYFVGTGENFYTNDIAFRADYVVLYLAQRQRLAPSPEIVQYFESQTPEKIITIHEVPYAKIYRGPKLILTDIPPDATPINIGLVDKIRLAGYKISPLLITNYTLTFYWHTLAPLSAGTNYTISVRAQSAEDELLAQKDSWPVAGLLPTSLWRQGDYVADTHTLNLSHEEASQVDHFEVVVYNLETGETLGPPFTLPLSETTRP